MESIYLYADYKEYLNYRMKATRYRRGEQKRLCETIGIQASFLSKVINKNLHLTPEQAMAIASYWGLNANEQEYFFELVNYARAGTPLLRKFLRDKLTLIKDKGNQISQRLTLPSLTDFEVESFYYSSWMVSAIHVLISIDGYQTAPAIANRLSANEELVRNILNQLKGSGLVNEKNGKWHVGHSNLHLSKNSPFQPIHQANWKLLAVQNVHLKSSGLHYCNVHSVSQRDFQMINEKILQFISESLEIIKASPAEKLAVINLDYFEP